MGLERTVFNKLRLFAVIALIQFIIDAPSEPLAGFSGGFIPKSIQIPVSGALGVIAYFYLRNAFQYLSAVDKKAFSRSAKYVLILIAGILVTSIAEELFATIAPTVQLFQPNGSLSPFAGRQVALDAVDLLGYGLTIVGLVWGTMSGVWRISNLYKKAPIRFAAVLLIIPIVNIFGAVLLLLEIHGITRN